MLKKKNVKNGGALFMDNENNELNIQQIRKKRVRTQQSTVSLFSIACLLFSCVWGVHAAGSSTRFFAPSEPDTSSVAEADAKKKNVKKTDSSSQQEEPVSDEQTESSVSHDENDDLSDALFIGDSRTVGLQNTCPYPKAVFLCNIGMHIDTALTSLDFTLSNGNAGTLIDAVSEGSYKRIFINLGLNDIGWPDTQIFIDYYTDLINELKTVQPDAEIYAEAILPVTAARELEGDVINNTNIARFNEAIEQVCQSTGATYLDCSEAIADENGYLPEEASTDGIHLLADYCDKWLQYIIDNT